MTLSSDRVQFIEVVGAVAAPDNYGEAMEHIHFALSKQKRNSQGLGSPKYLRELKNWLNPHEYWTGGQGKPECFVEVEEYSEGLLTLQVKSNSCKV